MGVSLLRKTKNQVSGVVIVVYSLLDISGVFTIQSVPVTSKCFGLALHFSPVLYHIPLFQTGFFKVNYLSLKKAGYDLKNYADRVEFFVSVKVDNIRRDQHNSSRHEKAEFSNCFIVY